MDESIGQEIQSHNFDAAKADLKEFSQKTADDMEISRVKDKDWLFVHKVTGDELNERLNAIQTLLIDMNNTTNKTIQEFGQVYAALEALDKEYIQYILGSLRAVKMTSDTIKPLQEDINQALNDYAELKEFKQSLDGCAHFNDIDQMWNDCQKISSIEDSIKKIDDQVLDDHINQSPAEEIKNHDGKKEGRSAIQKLAQRIRYAYIIAGASLILALVELVLIIARVV